MDSAPGRGLESLAAATRRRSDGAFGTLCKALAVRRPDDSRNTGTRELPSDWTRLVTLALAHQVVPLLFHALRDVHGDRIPEDINAAFEYYTEQVHAHNRTLIEHLLRVVRALEGEDIPTVPFKGPVLGLDAYGTTRLRVSRDIDIMVKRRDIERALSLLFDLGYEPGPEMTTHDLSALRHYAGQYILFHKESSTALEPHWAFCPSTLAFDIDYAALWSRVVWRPFRGHDIRQFADTDRFLVICIHAAKERWALLKHVCDLSRFIDAHAPMDWEGAMRQAQGWGCLRAVRVGLELVTLLFGQRLPQGLVEQVGRDRTAVELAQRAVAGMRDGRTADPEVYRLATFCFRVRERPGDRLRYVWRTLTTPRRHHYALLDLPKGLRWGYPLVKCSHDYLALPLWRTGKSMVGHLRGSVGKGRHEDR